MTARARTALALIALLAGSSAFAQYKIVGPDGSITYTDKPPAGKAAAPTGGNAAAPAAPSGQLPYETRQAMSRFPVTLYASRNCSACDQIRSWLKGRNVPFSEYAIETPADAKALSGRFGDTNVPVLTVGGTTMKSFNSADLENTINAAGYPAQARLVGYRWPAAVPLAPPAPAPAPRPAPAPTPAPAPQPDPTNGTGIRF